MLRIICPVYAISLFSISHHQPRACKAGKHQAKEADQVGAGAAGGGKGIAAVILHIDCENTVYILR